MFRSARRYAHARWRGLLFRRSPIAHEVRAALHPLLVVAFALQPVAPLLQTHARTGAIAVLGARRRRGVRRRPGRVGVGQLLRRLVSVGEFLSHRRWAWADRCTRLRLLRVDEADQHAGEKQHQRRPSPSHAHAHAHRPHHVLGHVDNSTREFAPADMAPSRMRHQLAAHRSAPLVLGGKTRVAFPFAV